MSRIIDIEPGRLVRLGGPGYFAGEPPATSDPADPDGRARILNVPSRVSVQVFERRSMQCIASTLSKSNGQWRIQGLRPDLVCAVIGFDNAGQVNAAIQDWVSPQPFDPATLRPMHLTGYVAPVVTRGKAVSWKVRAAYAAGPVTFSVTSGALPAGWSIASQETSCIITGTSTTNGDFTFELTGDDGENSPASQSYQVRVVEAFLFYRIVVTANNGDASFGTMVEVEMRATPGGPDQCAGGTATASSVANASNVAAFAFDDNLTTKWASATRPTVVAPQWLQYEFPALVSVRQIAICGAISGQTAMAPKDFMVQRSNNGVDWETFAWFDNQTGWSAGEIRVFNL